MTEEVPAAAPDFIEDEDAPIGDILAADEE